MSDYIRDRASAVNSDPAVAAGLKEGVLAQVLKAGRREARWSFTPHSMDDLTVLSVAKDPYRLDTPANHRCAQWFAEQVARFLPDGKIIHLRGLHYMLVAAGDVVDPKNAPLAYVNSADCWDFLQDQASKAARWLGYVPFARIKDQRNAAPELYVPAAEAPSPMRLVLRPGLSADCPDLYSLMPDLRWAGGRTPRQSYRIVLYGEKSSLGEVLRPIARYHEAELLLPTGESSETMVADMTDRAAQDDLIVLYFADFDPSGHQMSTSVSRKIQAHRDLRYRQIQADLHGVCLTLGQVREFNLPSTPLPEKELRADKWRAKYGHEQTEIDALAALRPNLLQEIAEAALVPFFDRTIAQRWQWSVFEFRDRADEWLMAQPQYEMARTEIENARDVVAAATSDLDRAQRFASDQLQQAANTADDLPVLPDEITPELTRRPPAIPCSPRKTASALRHAS